MEERFFKCHICNSDEVSNDNTLGLKSVSSDCKVIDLPFVLGFCRKCKSVVKRVDEDWKSKIQEIYEVYQIYETSNGEEKIVFDHVSGVHKRRSDMLFDCLSNVKNLKKNIDVLDVGSGSGVFLKCLSENLSECRLYAQDINDISEAELRNINKFAGLFVADLRQIKLRFDVVSMVHVLEHVTDPINFLIQAKRLLNDDGTIIVNVPNLTDNPIDLAVFDHCTHFTASTLNWVFQKAGYEVIYHSTSKIPKENVIIARASNGNFDNLVNICKEGKNIKEQLEFLHKMVQEVRSLNALSTIDIFGTALSSVWVSQYLKSWSGFFVDEDVNRIGRKLIGHEILSPKTLGKKKNVFIPFASKQAESIALRLSTSDNQYHWAK
jgi:2-polyprenyl-3-methyl-5-hydroxy-6-metoxy-1,4-benzoquinol methylase